MAFFAIFCVQNLKSLAQKMTEFWQLVQKSTNICSIIITWGFAYNDITYSDIAGIVIILFGPGPILLNKDHL